MNRFSEVIKRMKLGEYQRNYSQMTSLELELRSALDLANERYMSEVQSLDFEAAEKTVRKMEGYTSDLVELNYDMSNCQERINKIRKELGLREMKAGA